MDRLIKCGILFKNRLECNNADLSTNIQCIVVFRSINKILKNYRLFWNRLPNEKRYVFSPTKSCRYCHIACVELPSLPYLCLNTFEIFIRWNSYRELTKHRARKNGTTTWPVYTGNTSSTACTLATWPRSSIRTCDGPIWPLAGAHPRPSLARPAVDSA